MYASLEDDEMLMAIPGSGLHGLAERVRVIVQANSTLEELHVGRRAQF
ncbi:MAG: hypothetical protein HYY00_00235 [Chloroflexi bacterium]|nr:hypothetical protein [Chloroflexota bacterium]